MADARTHEPVLLEQSLEALAIRPGGIYVDGTFGRGGHSRAILARLGEQGRLFAIDKDPDAVAHGREALAAEQRFTIVQGTFAMLAELAEQWGVCAQVDGILLDLGVSSPQLDSPARGFSFRADGPLDMRMDPGSGVSAAQWLANAAEGDIARILKVYGEERYARRIARAIVRERAQAPIETTARLAQIVAAASPTKERHKDPATRTFQALRIHINRELDDLQAGLAQAMDVLKPGGRLAVISFHSLEDRMVKRFFRDQARGDEFPPDLPVTQDQLHPRLKLIGKAARASEAEVADNPRARSAVMRVAERLA